MPIFKHQFLRYPKNDPSSKGSPISNYARNYKIYNLKGFKTMHSSEVHVHYQYHSV